MCLMIFLELLTELIFLKSLHPMRWFWLPVRCPTSESPWTIKNPHTKTSGCLSYMAVGHGTRALTPSFHAFSVSGCQPPAWWGG